jgi:hypothetical protein
MDDFGNILIKRLSKSNIYVTDVNETSEHDTAISKDILCLPSGQLEKETPLKLFDMKKFQHNIVRELRNGYPDRRHLERQCINCISLVKREDDVLYTPCWIMLINVVALDMLRAKMPPGMIVFGM